MVDGIKTIQKMQPMLLIWYPEDGALYLDWPSDQIIDLRQAAVITAAIKKERT